MSKMIIHKLPPDVVAEKKHHACMVKQDKPLQSAMNENDAYKRIP